MFCLIFLLGHIVLVTELMARPSKVTDVMVLTPLLLSIIMTLLQNSTHLVCFAPHCRKVFLLLGQSEVMKWHNVTGWQSVSNTNRSHVLYLTMIDQHNRKILPKFGWQSVVLHDSHVALTCFHNSGGFRVWSEVICECGKIGKTVNGEVSHCSIQMGSRMTGLCSVCCAVRGACRGCCWRGVTSCIQFAWIDDLGWGNESRIWCEREWSFGRPAFRW
jgi:hypothetical protein